MVQVWLGHHSPSFTLDVYVSLLDEDTPESPLGANEVGHSGATEATETVRNDDAAEATKVAVWSRNPRRAEPGRDPRRRTRNEGVRGSSPRVGFAPVQGFPSRARDHRRPVLSAVLSRGPRGSPRRLIGGHARSRLTPYSRSRRPPRCHPARARRDAATGSSVMRMTQWFLPLGRSWLKPVCS